MYYSKEDVTFIFVTVYNDGNLGESTRAYALNYGEVRPDLLKTLLDNVATNWSH